MTTAAHTTSRWWRRALFLVGFGLLAFLLSACGGKIDTNIAINADGSGERTMTAVVASEDIAKVKGGAATIDRIIRDNTPSQLAYDGMSAEGTGTAYKFRLPFTSADDYEAKAVQLFAAGKIRDRQAEVNLIMPQNVFRQGVKVEESFTSRDLLWWANLAVVEEAPWAQDGTYKEDDMSELGATAVTFDGKTVPRSTASSGLGFAASSIDDRGVHGLTVTTSGFDADTFQRTIVFDMPREVLAADPDGFNKYFTDVTPEGATLTPPDGTGTAWTVTFSGNPADIVAATNKVLSSQNAAFAVDTKPSNNPNKPGVDVTVIDNFDCSAVCREAATPVRVLDVPEAWQAAYQSTSPSADPITFFRPVTVNHLNVDATFGPSDSRVGIAFTIPATDHEQIGEAFKALIQPPDGSGDVIVEETDAGHVYTATVQGSTPDELDTRFNTYLPNALQFLYMQQDENLFSTRSNLQFAMTLPADWYGTANTANYRVSFADGTSIDAEASMYSIPEGATVEGNTLVFDTAKGGTAYADITGTSLKLPMIIGAAALVLLAGAGIVFAVRQARKRPRTAIILPADVANPAGSADLSAAPVESPSGGVEGSASR